MSVFLQWNCRGLFSNYDDITFLINEHHPAAFCLQETHLKESHSNVLRHFKVFRKDRLNASVASGGVAVVVQRMVPSTEVALQTSLEAVAVRLLLDRVITVCSVYISPGYRLQFEELDNLIRQLPVPYIILGDFNAHNPLWEALEEILEGHSLNGFFFRQDCVCSTQKKPLILVQQLVVLLPLIFRFVILHCTPCFMEVHPKSIWEWPLSTHFRV